MRILLLEKQAREGKAAELRLSGRYEVRVAESLAEALLDLAQPFDRPDLVVTDLDLPDAQGPAMLRMLKEAAFEVPILVCDLRARDVGWQIEAAVELAAEMEPMPPGLREVAFYREREEQILAVRRAEVSVELERIAREAAEEAAREATDRLAERIGLDDREGLRRAVALARGFEAVKSRFLGAIGAGLGGALLFALAVGVLAILRRKLAD